jgi:UDPglucose 6-dehydrogenase
MKISVIGLGKLGSCSAACFASKGFEVIGVDLNKDFVQAINNGNTPIQEPGLQELITKAHSNLSATHDFAAAIDKSDVSFLIVPTPSQPDAHFSDKYLLSALEQLAAALKKSTKAYHLFVITSTVSPGTTESSLIPAIELKSGRKLNEGFGVCYNPEFIALGSVIHDFLNPDLVLIGESSTEAGDKLESIYRIVCSNKPNIVRMSLVSAEITKISLNSFVTMKISFANTLASLCESIPNADVDDITKALGADKRISPYYLKGGLSFGGPCFPRDNRAFSAFAKTYGIDAHLAKATDAVNEFHARQIVKTILNYVAKNKSKSVAVLGLAYKPNTPVIEESPAIRIIDELLKHNLEVIAFDPLAQENAKARFGDKIVYAASARDCFTHSSICIITTQADEFRAIDSSYIQKDPTIVIDCWRILAKDKLGPKVKYMEIGRFIS